MRNHGYQNYFDNEVLAASPLKLVQMLYDGALDSIAAARRAVRAGEIRARARAVNKSIRIVAELSRCLNHDTAGDLARNLAGLYAYVVRILIEANIKQTEAPLIEAEELISILASAWKACSPAAGFPIDEQLLRPVAASDASAVAR